MISLMRIYRGPRDMLLISFYFANKHFLGHCDVDFVILKSSGRRFALPLSP